MKRALLLLALVFLLQAGCRPRAKEITSLQRKEAAALASEADFAMSLRDLPRTAALLDRVVALCPDDGEHWSNLGSVRMRLGDRDGAERAYRSALTAHEEAARLNPKTTGPILHQIYVLALLGRVNDARKLLEKTRNKFPADRAVRDFAETKQLDQLIEERAFKEISL